MRQIDDLSSVPGKVRLNQTFTYDDRNRLVHATGSQNGFDFEYRYDDLGNLQFNGETGHDAALCATKRVRRRSRTA